MYNVRRLTNLIPIIWGFFIFDGYSQRIGKPNISLNDYIQIEIHKLRMSDVLDKIEIEDLNKEKTYNVLCHQDDYYMGEDTTIVFEKKLIKLKQLKEKGGKFKFNVKVISKTSKQLYIKQFNPSVERVEKIIKIKFI
jgi:hypothetical protein